MVTMRKYLILVMFAVLSKLSSGEDYTPVHNDLAEHAQYMDEGEPLTLPPPTAQAGCVMLNRPCGRDTPGCCEGGVCTETALYQAVQEGFGVIEYPLYTCLKHGQKVPIKIIKIGPN